MRIKLRDALIGCGLVILPGCVGLSPETRTKVVEAGLEPGKTEWCVDFAVIEPMCVVKNKERPAEGQ